jgi:hypothetical protein
MQANRTEQPGGQPVNNTITNVSDKMKEEELIRQELDQDDDKDETNVKKGELLIAFKKNDTKELVIIN